MTRQVLPQLEEFAATGSFEVAAAMSEYYYRSDDFRLFGQEDALRHEKFPRTPSVLSGICTAYVEEIDGRAPSIRRHGLVIPNNGIDLEQAYGVLIHDYKELIDGPHEAMQRLESSGYSLDDYMERAIKALKSEGLRTVASIAVFSSIEQPDEHVTGIYVPHVLVREMPLHHRFRWQGMLKALGPKKDDFLDAIGDDGQEMFRALMQNDPKMSEIALFIGAYLLPDTQLIEATMAEEARFRNPMKGAGQARNDGLSRAERRKLEHKKRRAERRKPNNS